MQHLYECLKRDIDYNPNQMQQFTQIQEPELPEFLYHLDEEEDPIPSFAMTNPYEALITHDPARQCVRVTPIWFIHYNLSRTTQPLIPV